MPQSSKDSYQMVRDNYPRRCWSRTSERGNDRLAQCGAAPELLHLTWN